MSERPGHGPYDTEAQARADAAALRSAWRAALYGAGVTGEQQRANARRVTTDHLTGALTAAGVALGAYDRRIAGWLAEWEIEVVQVVIGWVERAHATQDAENRRLAAELHAARDALRRIAERAQLALEDDCARQFAYDDVLDLARAALGDDEPDGGRVMSTWLTCGGAVQCVITSFGVLHAPAPEGDVLTLDLRRALRNPHHDPAMRQLTGLHPAVREHVLSTPGAEALINGAVFRVIAVLEGYAQPRGLRADLHVFCRGGRHRSVAAAEEIARRLRALGVHVEVEHRDIAKPVVQAGGVSGS